MVKKISLPKFDITSNVPYAQFVQNVTKRPTDVPTVQTPAMNNSRMNLFKALAKAKNKTVKTDESPSSPNLEVISKPNLEVISTPIPSPSPTLPETKTTSPVEIKSFKTPPSVSPSEDSFEMTPNQSEELINTEIAKIRFLKQFFLYTHSYSKYLNSRRSERKRRSCTSTEKTDFHYGNWELWEQKNAKKKKSQYLCSPPAKRVVKRKSNESDEPPAKLAKKTISRKSSSSSTSLCSLGDDYFKLCVVCYSSGENILTCSDCPAFFHRRCHKFYPTEFVNLFGTHCPNCIKDKHKLHNAS